MKRNLILLHFLLAALTIAAQEEITTKHKKIVPDIAIIQTMDGTKTKGWFYKMDDDHVYLLPAEKKTLQPLNYKKPDLNQESFKINALNINTITLKKKNAGSKGALIGFVSGVAIGAMIGFASGDDPVTPYTGSPLADVFIAMGNSFAMTAEEKAFGGALLGGLGGALVGDIIGKLLRKKFTIGGKKAVYHDLHNELMQRLMIK